MKRSILSWGWKIGCGLLGVYALSNLAHKIGTDPKQHTASAEHLYEKWIKSNEEKIPEKLEHLINTQSYIQKKFDPLIAQQALLHSSTQSCERVLAQLETQAPYHASFAKTSLLIKDKRYADALESAYTLKTHLENDTSIWHQKGLTAPSGSILYAFNLARIAILEQQLGNRHAEIATWTLLDNTQDTTYHPEARMLLEKAFTDNNLVLSDYISHRVSYN